MAAAAPDHAANIRRSLVRFFQSDLDHAAIDKEFNSCDITGVF